MVFEVDETRNDPLTVYHDTHVIASSRNIIPRDTQRRRYAALPYHVY